jgi:hypothetical protein
VPVTERHVVPRAIRGRASTVSVALIGLSFVVEAPVAGVGRPVDGGAWLATVRGPQLVGVADGVDRVDAVVLDGERDRGDHAACFERDGARCGLTANTILRAAKLRPGQTALVIGATTQTGTILMSLLAETGAYMIASGMDTIDQATGDPVVNALTSNPDLNLTVDLVSFGEPYFITRAARQGTIVSAEPRPDGPSIPRIRISAEPGDLAALALMQSRGLALKVGK